MIGWTLGEDVAFRVLRFMLGLGLLWLTFDGLRTGVAQLIYRLTSRRDEAALYWSAIALSGLFGSILVLGAVFTQLGRL